MATTKLTLAVDPQTVESAKDYAARHKTSVSALFSRYIDMLTAEEGAGGLSIPRGSVLSRVAGIAAADSAKNDDQLKYEALADKHGLDAEP